MIAKSRPAPRIHSMRTLRGSSYGALARGAKFRRARHLRTVLHPYATQEQVGRTIGMSRQAVEQTELRALAKIIGAFEYMTGTP